MKALASWIQDWFQSLLLADMLSHYFTRRGSARGPSGFLSGLVDDVIVVLSVNNVLYTAFKSVSLTTWDIIKAVVSWPTFFLLMFSVQYLN